jgi:hypothetical protein
MAFASAWPSAMPGILDRMVVVDVEVARRRNLQVDQRVAAELVEHVVEEAHARPVLVSPGSVEIDLDADVRLGGRPPDLSLSHGRLRSLTGRL